MQQSIESPSAPKSQLAERLLTVDVSQIDRRDRLRLAEYLWNSVATMPEEQDLAAAERRKLNRRIKLYVESSIIGNSWDEVKERLSWY